VEADFSIKRITKFDLVDAEFRWEKGSSEPADYNAFFYISMVKRTILMDRLFHTQGNQISR
jgi:hypothetical protein